MESIGFWCLGLLTAAVIYKIVYVALEPVIHYDGDSALVENIAGKIEDVMGDIAAVLFLSTPVAAVYGLYLTGRWVWSFI